MKDPGERDSTADQSTAISPRWTPARQPSTLRAGSTEYLLDHDPGLAEALDVRMQRQARTAATAVIFEADMGNVALDERLTAASSGPGLLVLKGVLSVNVQVGDRIASELLGPGDLVEPTQAESETLMGCATEWRGLVPTRFALLDGGFAQRARPWPEIMQTLLNRMKRRTRNLNVQRAITSQPRLEVRLALLLWHLAARWGRVEPNGIRLPLPLTHQLLGWLVGAERPSVSAALARLANSGLVTGHDNEWRLHERIDDHLRTTHPKAGRVVLLPRENLQNSQPSRATTNRLDLIGSSSRPPRRERVAGAEHHPDELQAR
jgi:CRP/FNR family cyclic AMP-dependent transcriptional regulator